MQRHTRPQHPGLARTARAGTLSAALLLAGLLATSGCGESTTTTAAAVAAHNTTTTPAAANTSPSAATQSAPTTTATPPTQAATTSGHGKSRAHLILPPPGSHPEPKLSASEAARLPVTDLGLSSTGIKAQRGPAGSTIAAAYTCNGADHSPPLHWTGIPPGTQELALFALSSAPVNNKLFFAWAIAGINPKLTGLQAGQLPPGAVQGRNSQGHTTYNICPPNTTKPETYIFILYALPKTLHPQTDFNPTTLRQQAKQIARHTGLLAGTT